MGGNVRKARASEPFFRRKAVKQTIARLAKARNLTIFVGAGVGTEIGLPDWPQLVRRLLADAVAGPKKRAWDRPLSADNREIVDLLLERESLLSAATIAKALLGRRFKDSLRRALYGQNWGDSTLYVPVRDAEHGHLASTTAEAVAAVYQAFAEAADGQWSCDIVTTNYDLSLEEALDRIEIKAEPWTEDGGPADDSGIEHVVRHLHGYLTETEASDKLVLTEADYHEAGADKLSWQESYLRRRLSESTVVFVGTSLSDPDILSVLFRYASSKRRAVALLADKRLGSGSPDVPAPPDPYQAAYEKLALARWETAGLDVLRADYLAQPRQFLWEVAMHKQDPTALRYGERLDAWYREIADGVPLALFSADTFGEAQDDLCDLAGGWLEDVRDLVREAGHPSVVDESLAIHLWSRSTLPLVIGESKPKNLCAMAMVVCSDRAWRWPQAVDTRRIMQPTRRAAIEAFCDRRVLECHHDGSYQWNYVLAVPVVLTGPGHARLPVGSITLESTTAAEDTTLKQLTIKERQDVVEYLRGVGEACLSATSGKQ